MTLSDIPVYVISVKTFIDRHSHIEALSRSYGFQFEYIFDYDADTLTEADWNGVDRSMNPKSVSNTLKHLEAQRKLIASGEKVGLVLEDDVILFDGFEAYLEQTLELTSDLADGWLVFLGGADNKIDARFVESTKLALIDKPISTAEAYLIDVGGSVRRQEWLVSNTIDRQADHQLKLIDQSLGIRHFWTSIPLATQGSITGKFATALDASRAKHSPLFLGLKYRWNCWRRQTLPRFFGNLFSGRD